MSAALTETERLALVASLRLEAAIHDLPPEAVAPALLMRTAYVHGRQNLSEEAFLSLCREGYRRLAPGFALMDGG